MARDRLYSPNNVKCLADPSLRGYLRQRTVIHKALFSKIMAIMLEACKMHVVQFCIPTMVLKDAAHETQASVSPLTVLMTILVADSAAFTPSHEPRYESYAHEEL